MEEPEHWFSWQPEVFYQPPEGVPYAVVLLNHALDRHCVGHVNYLWQKACVRVCVDGGTNDYQDLMCGLGDSTETSPPHQPLLTTTSASSESTIKTVSPSLETHLSNSASSYGIASLSFGARPSPAITLQSLSTPEANGLPHPLTELSDGPCAVPPSLSHQSPPQTSSHLPLPLPDFISGDFDSVRPELLKLFASLGVKIIPTPDQDETDFTKAIKLLAQHVKDQNIRIQHILVVAGVQNDRFDHVMAHLATLFKVKSCIEVPVIMLYGGSLLWLLEDGRHKVQVSQAVVESPIAAWCGLIPVGHPATVTTTGLKWNLKNQTLAFGTLVSTSNTYDLSLKGSITITTSHPILWTMGWVMETVSEENGEEG